METVRILERPTSINWDYDEEADVLYLSVGEPRPALGMDIGDGVAVGEPRPALGMDIGDGVVVRYDEARKEVVGLTLIGLRARLMKSLAEG
ncbi:MAG: DUF2283 domain-containing protein [Chloroflexi bacterium]|nr:DUF2283 domain-containing protein [Chloroflexota bacterium]